MTAVQAVKANKLSIPQEIVEKLGIAKEDVLAFEVVDEDTLNVRILRKKIMQRILCGKRFTVQSSRKKR
jgi:bifunctional DNA-binding transcriptional regulator/antitoxin component of YhaV-PrlF toxin-antitoxin module